VRLGRARHAEERLQTLLVALLLPQRQPQVDPAPGMLAVDRQAVPQMLLGLIELPPAVARVAQVVQQVGVPGVDLQRRLQFFLRSLSFSRAAVANGQPSRYLLEPRIVASRALVLPDRLGVVAVLL